ncbi:MULTISPECIES: coiled-coil domain-containing protein [Aeromonas]|jgi:colicin import membrane protein|uniref:DNA-binding protein n=2 Tax=Aeromonas TaxID=642 RepID=A0AAW5RQA9_AERME|nr:MULTISPECIES: DNA-binding protein [Aeromonas]MCV3290358.1 DNA-binding protein [Aeromonas media]MDX7719293.1 DNA-binding protein [Aeromonas caviae]
MRTPEISDEVIIEAGNRLLKADTTISGFKLARECKGGNPTRLMKVWTDFLKTQVLAGDESKLPLPLHVEVELEKKTADISKFLIDTVTELHHQAIVSADLRVSEEQAKAQRYREELLGDLEEASNINEQVTNDLREAQVTITGLNDDLKSANAQREQLAIEVAQLRERLSAVEQAEQKCIEDNKELAIQVAEINKVKGQLHNELVQLRERLTGTEEAMKNAAAAHAKAISESTEDKQAVLTQLDEVKRERDTLHEELVQQRERRATAESALQAANEALTKANSASLEEIGGLRQQIDELTHSREELIQRQGRDSEKLTAQEQALASAKEDCEISLQEAVKAQEEATQARVEVARLEGHLTSLTKQNVDLIAALSGKAPHSS